MSDGENTGGPDPAAVAQLAADAGVHVSTIGVGTAEGAVITVDGYQVATALDEQALRDWSPTPVAPTSRRPRRPASTR